jgi:transposase, IS5 family
MAYRKPQRYFSFADLAVEKHANKNRALSVLKQLNRTIDWNPINELLSKFYDTGKSEEGGKAYPPLLLFKCLLLQKWFQIPSDPELESQINDRISFKSFLGLPIDQAAPDHCTFSRFRSRLSKQTLIQLNNTLLAQFNKLGLSINEGIAVDARLVKSASKPISNEKIDTLKEKQQSPEGKLDKNGKPKKFTRDLESDWTIKNDLPHYGIKEHAAVDVENGFILSTTITAASHSDSTYLPYATIYSMHTDQKIQIVYADKGYAGSPNRTFLSRNHIADGIMRKNNINAALTENEIARNKAISKKRYIVEQYFGIATLFDDHSRARFTTIIKNGIDAMFRQFAFDLKKAARILKYLPA